MSRLVAETPIGKTAEVEIWRNSQKQAVKVLIEQMPEEPKQQKENILPLNDETETIENLSPAQMSDFGLGFSLSEINSVLADKYQLSEDTAGMIVTAVDANSDAAKKGIKTGDLITQIDKKPIIDGKDVANYVSEAILENRRPVLLQIKDGEQLHFVAVKLSDTKPQLKESK